MVIPSSPNMPSSSSGAEDVLPPTGSTPFIGNCTPSSQSSLATSSSVRGPAVKPEESFSMSLFPQIQHLHNSRRHRQGPPRFVPQHHPTATPQSMQNSAPCVALTGPESHQSHQYVESPHGTTQNRSALNYCPQETLTQPNSSSSSSPVASPALLPQYSVTHPSTYSSFSCDASSKMSFPHSFTLRQFGSSHQYSHTAQEAADNTWMMYSFEPQTHSSQQQQETSQFASSCSRSSRKRKHPQFRRSEESRQMEQLLQHGNKRSKCTTKSPQGSSFVTPGAAAAMAAATEYDSNVTDFHTGSPQPEFDGCSFSSDGSSLPSEACTVIAPAHEDDEEIASNSTPTFNEFSTSAGSPVRHGQVSSDDSQNDVTSSSSTASVISTMSNTNSSLSTNMRTMWTLVALFLTEQEWLTNFILISKNHLRLIQQSPLFSIDLAQYDEIHKPQFFNNLMNAMVNFHVRSIRLETESQIALAYKNKKRLTRNLRSLRLAVRSNLPVGELLHAFTKECPELNRLHFHDFFCSHSTLTGLLNRIHDRSCIRHLVFDFVLDEMHSRLNLFGFTNLLTLKTRIPMDDFDYLPELVSFEGKLTCCPSKLEHNTPKLRKIKLSMNKEQFPRYETISHYLRPKILSIETDAHEERFFKILHDCPNLTHITNSRAAFLSRMTHKEMFERGIQYPNIVYASVTLFDVSDILKLMFCFPNLQDWSVVHVPSVNCKGMNLSDLLETLKEKFLKIDATDYSHMHSDILEDYFAQMEPLVAPFCKKVIPKLGPKARRELRLALERAPTNALVPIIEQTLSSCGSLNFSSMVASR